MINTIYCFSPNSTQHRNVLYEARGIVRNRSEVSPCPPPIWQQALLPLTRTRAVSSWQGEEGEEERERREKGREREERKKPRDRPGQFDCQIKSRLSRSEKKTVVLPPPTCKRKSPSESCSRNRHRVPFKIRSGFPKASSMRW